MYRAVALVVKTAHGESGMNRCNIAPFARECVNPKIDPMLDCIPPGEAVPTRLFDIGTGEVAGFSYLKMKRDKKALKKAKKRYPAPPDLRGMGPIEHARERLELSKHFLEADGYAGTMLMLSRGTEGRLLGLQFADDEPKDLKLQGLVESVGSWPFDGVVLASEMWMGEPGTRGQLLGVHPEQLLDSNRKFFGRDSKGGRDEALVVIALTADGRSRFLGLPFGRTVDGFIYGELIDDDSGEYIPHFLHPLWQRWPTVGQRAPEAAPGPEEVA